MVFKILYFKHNFFSRENFYHIQVQLQIQEKKKKNSAYGTQLIFVLVLIQIILTIPICQRHTFVSGGRGKL